jgi:hypothetical protein
MSHCCIFDVGLFGFVFAHVEGRVISMIQVRVWQDQLRPGIDRVL